MSSMNIIKLLNNFLTRNINLEQKAITHKNNFSKICFIDAYSFKPCVIDDEIFKQLSNQNNISSYIFLHKHINNSLWKIFNDFNSIIQIINLRKKQDDSFAYNFKIDLQNYHKGYILFSFFPDIKLSEEQYLLFRNFFINEFVIISKLLYNDTKYIKEYGQKKHKYFHMNSEQAIYLLHNQLTELLNSFLLQNKKHEQNFKE